jgi:predicted RecA/RadA family phage recombinase
MANEYRKAGNVISWTNNLTTPGTVAKGSLVHLGAGKFGVAVDAIASGASGEVIVKGAFTGGSAIIDETVKVGQSLVNNDANIIVVAQLKTQVTASAGATIDMSNLYLAQDITASSAAQSFNYVLI